MKDKKTPKEDRELTNQEKEVAALVEQIAGDGEHDFAELVETVGATLLTAQRLAKIVFDTEEIEVVFDIYDRLDIGSDEDDED